MNYYKTLTTINDLIGAILVEITGCEKDSEEIIFKSSDGKQWKMFHLQDCCEDVYLEDVCGDVKDLINSPILRAECVTEEDYTKYGTCTWSFYKFATINGEVVIRWYGASNGYYSEKVDFMRITT
jgi:hypothetical protein